MSRIPASHFLKMVGVLVAVALAAPHTATGASSGGGSVNMPSTSGRGADPARAYQEGVAAMQARDYRTAVTKFRIAVDAAPNDPGSNYAYALALIGAGESRDAIRPLQRSLRSDAAPPDARKQLGLIYLQQGDRPKATEQLTALSAALAACNAACGDARRTQLQAAHDALKAALDAPAAPVAPTTGWLLPGVSEGRAAYAAAVGFVNQERFVEALSALDVAQAAIGPHPDILNYRGFASRKLGRFDAAIAYYGEALAIDPDHRGANEYLGELYLQLGRVDDARRQLAKLDTLCPYGCAEREELGRWITGAAR